MGGEERDGEVKIFPHARHIPTDFLLDRLSNITEVLLTDRNSTDLEHFFSVNHWLRNLKGTKFIQFRDQHNFARMFLLHDICDIMKLLSVLQRDGKMNRVYVDKDYKLSSSKHTPPGFQNTKKK